MDRSVWSTKSDLLSRSPALRSDWSRSSALEGSARGGCSSARTILQLGRQRPRNDSKRARMAARAEHAPRALTGGQWRRPAQSCSSVSGRRAGGERSRKVLPPSRVDSGLVQKEYLALATEGIPGPEATALMHVVDSLDELRLPRNLRELHLTRHRISRIDLPADTLASLQKARHAFCASRARATSNHARTRHSSTCGRTASRE